VIGGSNLAGGWSCGDGFWFGLGRFLFSWLGWRSGLRFGESRLCFGDWRWRGGEGGGIDDLLDAVGLGGERSGGGARGVIGNDTGKSHDAVSAGDIHRRGLQKRIGEHFGFDIGRDGVVGDFAAAANCKCKKDGERKNQRNGSARRHIFPVLTSIMGRASGQQWLRQNIARNKAGLRPAYMDDLALRARNSVPDEAQARCDGASGETFKEVEEGCELHMEFRNGTKTYVNP
jgi:hypothetical protein